jgi:hypothetical protein
MPTQSLMMNPMLATLSPDDQQSLLQLQQRQAIGQALLQQGLQPIDTSNRQVGGMGYRISPLEGLAKMAQMYTGNKISMDSMGKQAQLMGQMYGNAFGTNQPQQAPQQAAVDAGGMTGDQSGQGVISSPVPSGAQLGAAMGGGPQAAPQVAMPNGALTLPGKTPQQSMMLFSMLGPEGYARLLSQWGAPTDATRMAMAAGADPRAANENALYKANYIAPITGTGAFRDPRTMQPVAFNPDIPAGTTPLYDASGNVAKVQPIDGAQAAMQGNAAATAAGGAQFKPVQVYNPATQQMEYSNEAAVTNPGAPAPLRNNNPGALMPGGKLANYPDMQSGLQALDQNLASYGKQGVNTLSGVISKWAPPSENNTQAYIADVSQRLGIKPDQKIDLSNPLVRQSLSTAIALHENGPSGVFGGGSGAPAAAPPLGAQANAEGQAKSQLETMTKSYQNLQTVRSGAPAALQDIDNMIGLSQGKSPTTVGPYAASAAALFSSNAAEYEKSRDNLVTNLGSQLGINSDAARELVYGSIPSYGAPKQAIQNGLATLKGQVQTRLLKSDFLSDAYAAGDAKSYNQRENQFDQNITPQIANVVTMPPGPQRADALKQAAQNPQMRARLEWAAKNGVLK